MSAARRTMTRIAAACALAAGLGGAQAQHTQAAGVPGVVSAGTTIEFIKDGFKGTEGPIGLPDGSLVFTETQDARITRIAPDGSVYRITVQGRLELLASDITRPNGIQLSPDEKVLYVADTAGDHVLAYDLAADGKLGPRRNFAKLAGFTQTPAGPSSGADGLAIDALGRLYVASTAGVQVFDDQGKALGVIALPKAPQNLAFAGIDRRTLYVVGRGAAYRIATLAPGVNGRAK